MRRETEYIFKGEQLTEGAGVKLLRLFGYFEVPMFDRSHDS